MRRENSRGSGDELNTSRLLWALLIIVLSLFLIADPKGFNSLVQLITINLETQTGHTEVIEGSSTDEGLFVAVIDVGQGDSIFLASPDGHTMLIDAGPEESYETIDGFLRGRGIDSLDAVVATHPHSDHIGGMAKLIDNYDIGKFYMPEAVNATAAFENMLSALEDEGVETSLVWGGEDSYIEWGEGARVHVLSPLEGVDYGDNLNDYSVTLRVSVGETSILLTGDADGFAEETMLERLDEELLAADVLKVGHHGSAAASTQAFLNAVAPKIAVISLSKDNPYGHPNENALARLGLVGAKTYRTDRDGTVFIQLDGKGARVSLSVQQSGKEFSYFLHR